MNSNMLALLMALKGSATAVPVPHAKDQGIEAHFVHSERNIEAKLERAMKKMKQQQLEIEKLRLQVKVRCAHPCAHRPHCRSQQRRPPHLTPVCARADPGLGEGC